MEQLTALTVLAAVYAFANLLSQKLHARVSMMFICSCTFLTLFWNGMPTTIFADSKVVPLSSPVIAVLMVQMGSMMDASKMKQEWKTVCAAFFGMCAGAAGILLLASRFIGWLQAVAATGPISGGVVAGLIMTEAADAKGLTEISVFVALLLTAQGFFGTPTASNCLLAEGKRLKARFAAGERASESTANASAPAKKRLIPPLPKRWQTSYVFLFKAFLVAWIAGQAAKYFNAAVPSWAAIHPFVMTLIFGIVAHELGFIETNVLHLANANGMFMYMLLVPIFMRLAKATPQMVLSMIGPLLIVFAATLAGIFLFSYPLSKLLGYSWALTVALGATCMIGFPGTLIISEEVSHHLAESEEEREFILSQILPKMLIAGFVTVTITSVFLAGFLVKFF